MDAFESFQRKTYHILITDIGLPDRSGYELAQMIRAYEKENMLHLVPIIGLTAHAHNGIKNKCLSSGMQDVLSKPISKKILSETILYHCGLKSTAEQPTENEHHTQQSSQHVFYYASYEQYPLLEWDIAQRQFGSPHIVSEMMKQFLEDDLSYAKAHSITLFESNNLAALGALVHRIHGATVYCATERLNRITRHLDSAIHERNEIATKNLYPIWQYILHMTMHEIEKQLFKTHEIEKV